MSSPPNGRALALPLVWRRRQGEVVTLPGPSAIPSPSDEELLTDLQTSDAKALDVLFRRYSRLVFGIAARIVRDYSEAEEVVQETFFDTLVGKSDVEREIGAKLDFANLQEAFEDLTLMQRRTLELFYFEGFELKEISERLHEPFGNVRHHFYRVLERLRMSPSVQRLRGNER